MPAAAPAEPVSVRRPRRWRLLIAGFAGVLLLPLVVAASVGWVRRATHGHVYDVAGVPAAPVALVLGAQVYADGTPSPFLAARLDVARRLFDAGTVRAVLVSGDHGRWGYDEPGVMRRWLADRGVPPDKIDDSVRRFRRAWLRGWGREQLAAVQAVYDVASRRDPVFLGLRETGIDEAVRN